MLPVGASAPDFVLRNQHGQQVALESFRGDRSVVLVFFPLAFTPVCQGELDELQESLARFQNDDVAVLTISVGPPQTHKVWATQSGFTFPVLSDFWPHGAVARAYDVFNDGAGIPNRGTFVIDTAGVIRFAEEKSPGEPRDQAVWKDALEALMDFRPNGPAG